MFQNRMNVTLFLTWGVGGTARKYCCNSDCVELKSYMVSDMGCRQGCWEMLQQCIHC